MQVLPFFKLDGGASGARPVAGNSLVAGKMAGGVAKATSSLAKQQFLPAGAASSTQPETRVRSAEANFAKQKTVDPARSAALALINSVVGTSTGAYSIHPDRLARLAAVQKQGEDIIVGTAEK